jgi:hypothetical protein
MICLGLCAGLGGSGMAKGPIADEKLAALDLWLVEW